MKLFAILCVASLAALAPRVLAADRRMDPPKDLDGFFPWVPPASAEAWTARKSRVREQTQASLGLWPLPARTPLRAVSHGLVERDDYTVERVFFESAPGFYVTGSLYRPKSGVGGAGVTGRRAGVLWLTRVWESATEEVP